MASQSETDIGYLHEVTIGDPVPLREPIEIRDYDPVWPQTYARLRDDIRRVLRKGALDIAHVGSTSVPGLAAKPIIDIDLTVADPGDEDAYVPALETLDYRLRIREPQWHEHRLLKLDEPQVHLHVFGPDAEPAHLHRAFRDRLRASSKDRQLYADTKRELAQQNWTYMQEYADAKTTVVNHILANATDRGTRD
ncbi:MAG TPA: GrpB family protein [Candidatus Stackebrandtia faecavium]|nr:GrpB family protein [Candidatus Stackebrandtia faecavium]